MSTIISKLYQIRPNDVVTLKITIGHGQVGVSTVSLGTSNLAERLRDNLDLFINRPGENLVGKTLICVTTVSDVRMETNETSVTFELTGGITPFKQTLQESVPNHGDVLIYAATFRFFQ